MDYMLKKNYQLRFNYHKTSKSQSTKQNKIQKNTTRDTFKNRLGGDIKKYKSTNKNISLNSLPKLDSYFTSTTNNPYSKSKKGQFELFVRNKTAYFKNSDLRQENLNNEEFGEIALLWEELGITDEYQDQFELYLSSIANTEYKNRFLMIEKNNLIKIKEALTKFSKGKINRNKNIELLKKLNNILKENKIFEANKIGNDLLKEINECIKSIRLNAVNVVNNLLKVREAMSCYSLEDKINFEKINDNYFFDNNYLLKINSEMSFLKYSEIGKIFEKKEEEEYLDTFLTIYTDIKNGENEKISNPISKELMNAIDKCRYYIMQDSILNNIKKKKILKINNKKNGQKLNNKNKYKINSQMVLSNAELTNLIDVKLHQLKTELGSNYNNIFIHGNKQNSNINLNNNKRINFLKNQMNNNKKVSNINIERNEFPYKINLDEYKNETNKKEKFNDSIGNLKEESDLLKKKENNKNSIKIKYDEEEIKNEKKNNNDDKNEIKKDNIMESDIKNENQTQENEEEKNKDIKIKKEDEEDKIVDMDYLDYIKEK